jgi:hydrogenase/urease accessory protein HupE
MTFRTALFAAAVMALPTLATAHPAPFSYLDIQLRESAANFTLVVHIFDVAHDIGVEPPERLLDPVFLATRAQQVVAMLTPRIRIGTDYDPATTLDWSNVTPLPDRQSIQLQASRVLSSSPSVVNVAALIFPYDIAHQTFVNVYESEPIALQAILDRTKTRLDFYTASPAGRNAVLRGFVGDGFRHVFLGPEHLVFLAGLVLLGGTARKLGLIVIAFAGAHALMLTLGALNVLRPPVRLIEPGIALSIIYLGADNLMVRGGRDVRIWIAAAFGALHGLGFAATIRALDLSQSSVRWSTIGFNTGIATAEAILVVAVGLTVDAVRARHPALARRIVYAGSVVVIAAGAVWFVRRVFFPAGAA